MKVLLDTHAFLWWLDGDKRLPVKIRKLLADVHNEILVSAASAWEVTTKYRIGKLPNAELIAKQFSQCIADQGFTSLSISTRHAEHAGLLSGTHRDPFDRMLIAQSVTERVSLVSNEEIFDAYGVERLW